MAENIANDRLHIGLLVAAPGEGATADSVRVDNLEEEHAASFVTRTNLVPAVADGRHGAADEATDKLVNEREAIALVSAEWQEELGLLGVASHHAVLVDRGVGWEVLAFPGKLLDTSHGNNGGGPVDDDGVADGVGGGEAPGMRIGTKGREFAPKRDDFSKGSSAVGVGDVAALRSVHDVATAPEIMKGVVH